MVPSNDNVYWTFSAAAQALATVIAFLLAGYTLVHSLMETIAAADETLREVSEELRRRYHRRLFRLTMLTAFAITLDLALVYVNGHVGTPLWLQSIAAAVTVISLLGAVLFYSSSAKQYSRPRWSAAAAELPAMGMLAPTAMSAP